MGETIDYSHCRYWLETLRLEKNTLKNISQIRISKGSGRGGQKVNKTVNAVDWKFGHFVVRSHKTRSLQQNMQDCFHKLQLQIALNILPSIQERPQRELIPELMQCYFLAGKYKINQSNPDYPYFCGYVIDILCQTHELKQITETLMMTSSQFKRWIISHRVLYQKYQQILLLQKSSV